MNSRIAEKRTELARICQKHHVRHLELFGSAAMNSSYSARSDIDCLVNFEELTPTEHADAFFGLLEDLEGLFGCEVDLVERRAIRNPYFLEAIEEQRITLYAAA
jgi:predicted nucleotidyltransferase